jgi:hypothetical protein
MALNFKSSALTDRADRVRILRASMIPHRQRDDAKFFDHKGVAENAR